MDDDKAHCVSQVGKNRSRQGIEKQFRIEASHRVDDGPSDDGISRGHIVERAVRFDMREGETFLSQHSGQSMYLFGHQRCDVVRRQTLFGPAERRAVRQAGMGSDGNAMPRRD